MIRVIRQRLARRKLQRKIKAIKKNSYNAGVKAAQSIQEVTDALASFAEGLRDERLNAIDSQEGARHE